MAESKDQEICTVQQAREDYFAGKISAEEYLRRAMPAMDHDRRMAEQFARIFHRMRSRDR